METAAVVGTRGVEALHARDGRLRAVEDQLAEEGALQILVDGAAYSMTMRTPGQDIDLVVGLLHGEGLLASCSEVESIREQAAADEGCPDSVEIGFRKRARKGAKPSERRLISNASCGVCGKVSADDLEVPVLRAGRAEAKLELALLPALEGRMRAAQALFGRTGGTHAAAVFDREGNLLVIREDVGRHNAVDKAVGHLLRERALDRAAILFISGRVSYEIVSKAAKADIPFLLAVSAPSTLAVKLCREAGITLLAFCRGGKATIYSHPERVRGGSGPADGGFAGAEGFAADEDAEGALAPMGNGPTDGAHAASRKDPAGAHAAEAASAPTGAASEGGTAPDAAQVQGDWK